MRITAIEKQPRRRRANLFVDGAFALAASLEVVQASGLRPGDDIDASRLAEIHEAEARQAAMSTALRLLAYRPRSAVELKQRLLRKGSGPALIEETIQRLRDLALVDDEAFARSWAESRDRTSPRGRRLVAWELQAKGVARPAIVEAVAGLDDEDAAYRAAGRRGAALAGLPRDDFHRRLSGFLLRRGFSGETARATVARLWRETTGNVHGDGEEATG